MMGFILGCLIIAIVAAIASAINALAAHWAAALAEAEYPDYSETFKTIFWGYIVFFMIILVIIETGNVLNGFFAMLLWLSIIGWVMYKLVHKLGIEGNKNIIIFVGMSFFFNMLISFAISLFNPF